MRWLFGNVERLHSPALLNAGIIPKSGCRVNSDATIDWHQKLGNTIPSIHFPA